MEQKKKTKAILFSIVGILAVAVIVLLVCRSIHNSVVESEYFDYDDNLGQTENSLVIDATPEEIYDYVSYDYDGVDLSSSYEGEIYLSDDNPMEITTGGTYVLSGTLDGQVIVDTEESVKIVLNGVDLSCSDGSPIVVENAKEVILILADGTTNYITDTSEYQDPDTNEDATPAAIFSRDDLYISGSGTLIISSENKCGIQSKDQLVILGGDITIDAAKEAIKAKDYFVMEDGNLDLTAGEDGLAVTEDDDVEKGYMVISGGTIKINAQQDGLTAKTYIVINDADLDITTNTADTSKSAKGIKAGYYLEINSGTIDINSKDDGLHSNSQIVINGGDITISSGDDGIHADEVVEINNGNIDITKSYEGIEGKNIYIDGGEISIVSSDDGINVADSSYGETMQAINGAALYISGGKLYVNANGDGLDSNGNMYITGGEITVDGPTNNGNGGLDCNGELVVDGGFLVVASSSGMAEAPDQTSEQNSVIVGFESTMSAGTLISIKSSNGDELVSYAPVKTFQAFVFSSDDLETGVSYEVFVNGESYEEFTISSATTTVGTVGGMGMDGPGGMQPPTGGMARPGRW